MRTCRTTAGSAFTSCCVAQETLSRSSTNISRRRLPGPRNGLVGHRSWSSTNISQLLSTSHQSGIAFVVRRPTSHNCVNFTHFRLPRKKGDVPRHAKLQKKTTTDQVLILAPLLRTCLHCLPSSTPDSRPRRARTARGWLFTPAPGPKGKGQQDLTRQQRGEADNEQRSLVRLTPGDNSRFF